MISLENAPSEGLTWSVPLDNQPHLLRAVNDAIKVTIYNDSDSGSCLIWRKHQKFEESEREIEIPAGYHHTISVVDPIKLVKSAGWEMPEVVKCYRLEHLKGKAEDVAQTLRLEIQRVF